MVVAGSVRGAGGGNSSRWRLREQLEMGALGSARERPRKQLNGAVETAGSRCSRRQAVVAARLEAVGASLRLQEQLETAAAGAAGDGGGCRSSYIRRLLDQLGLGLLKQPAKVAAGRTPTFGLSVAAGAA